MIETPVETSVPLGLDQWEEQKYWRSGFVSTRLPKTHPLNTGTGRVSSIFVTEAAAWRFRWELREFIVCENGAPQQVTLEGALSRARQKGYTLLLRNENLEVIDRWAP
jgi:hypothetical protein